MRWIKLDTSITQWEWFQDANTLKLWIFLLANANYKESKYKGLTIDRGQYLTSVRQLSHHLQIAEMTVQRILKNLKDNGSIEIQKNNSLGTIITIVNYSSYQADTNNEQSSVSTEVSTVTSTAVSTATSTAVSTATSTQSKKDIEEKEIYKEKEMRVTLARTWEEELKNDEMWTEQLAMRLKVTTEVVRNGISEATSTFIIDNDVPRDRQSYRIRTRQYIDSHLAKIIRPAADAVSEQTRRYADTKEDRGNRIDEHARRLHETLRATYEAIKSGAAAAGRNASI